DGFLSFIPFRRLHFIHSFKPHPCHSPQKNSTAQQKDAPALRVPRRQPQPSLRCGLPASATLAPLAVGSRLSTTQAKKSLRYAPQIFYLLRFGSGLFYLRCFGATPTPSPDHPPLKQLNFLFYLRYHAGF
ncbi:MAG: hypothetical protein LBR75_00760, partial [Prevotellaceae bacterium]|nr:hypothetical protein [Prevotellaceae bacterium]